jgi:hypothetical protein
MRASALAVPRLSRLERYKYLFGGQGPQCYHASDLHSNQIDI